jgi:hypothetical protein
MSIVDEAGSGDQVRALTALRDKLAAELDAMVGKDCAPLARALVAVLEKLNALGVSREESAVDDLAARRTARRAAAGL